MPGALRLLAYDTRAHMGSYQATINNPSLGENIYLTAAYRYKYGFGINLEQEIRKNLGAFARLGWSDGKNQTYEFTDVDRTATAGLSLKGARWRRPEDTVGLGGGGQRNQRRPSAVPCGWRTGDHRWRRRSRLPRGAHRRNVLQLEDRETLPVTLDYQFAQNPAYNHVRGPVEIIALRFHTEY